MCKRMHNSQENPLEDRMKRALNRITMPKPGLEEFLKRAKAMHFDAVEVRNDLGDGRILDGLDPSLVRRLCAHLDLGIITINALQRFNDRAGTIPARITELRTLVDLASRAGIEAVVLCPVNDRDEARSCEQRMEDTVRALDAYAPIFTDAGVKGYIEPLGFSFCSLRYKRDAATAIEASVDSTPFSLVHDTFHHYLAQEEEFFPELTALVHISGVTVEKPRSAITDDDRILVTASDIMGNKKQLEALSAAGWRGWRSYECFSSDVAHLESEDLATQIAQSWQALEG